MDLTLCKSTERTTTMGDSTLNNRGSDRADKKSLGEDFTQMEARKI